MQIKRGPGRGLSQAPAAPGWAGKRPKMDNFRSYPPENKTNKSFDLESLCAQVWVQTGHGPSERVLCA